MVTTHSVLIVVPQLEEENARKHGLADRVLVYREDGEPVEGQKADAFEEIRDLVKSENKGSIGVEKEFLPLQVLQTVLGEGEFCLNLLQNGLLVDAGDYLASARAVKDELELGHIRRAAYLVSEAVQATRRAVYPGKTEFEIEFEGTLAVVRQMKEVAPEGFGFITITASGVERTVLPHALTCNRALDDPDIMIHRRHIGVKGYEAESERTLFVNRPSPKQREIFEVMLRAQKAAIEAVQPGVPVSVVDEASRAVFEGAGLLRFVQHRTGHGLGLEPHERPFLRRDDTTTLLLPGMVFSVEPGVYVPGIGGFRHSDSVLVTEYGKEVLTHGGTSIQDCTIV